MIINVNNVKIIMIIIIIMIRCEAPRSLPWEREVVQQLVVLAVLVATIRLVSSSILAMIIVIVVNIIIVPRQFGGPDVLILCNDNENILINFIKDFHKNQRLFGG